MKLNQTVRKQITENIYPQPLNSTEGGADGGDGVHISITSPPLYSKHTALVVPLLGDRRGRWSSHAALGQVRGALLRWRRCCLETSGVDL
jgi:hypothetical protein